MAEEESLRIQQAEEGVSELDAILDAFDAELALERELGTRVFEIDRALLKPLDCRASQSDARNDVKPQSVRCEREVTHCENTPSRHCREQRDEAIHPNHYDFVFLHDKALSAKAIEVMAKILAAMRKTVETAPIVIERPIPKAQVYVVLGTAALKKFLPGKAASPGQWLKSDRGADVLVTYTPEDFVRFNAASPAVQAQKKAMWASLKDVMKRTETK